MRPDRSRVARCREAQGRVEAVSSSEDNHLRSRMDLWAKLALSGRNQEQRMPTQVIPADQFRDALVKLTGLTPQIVDCISARLAFDCRTKSPCIFQQPLVVGGGNVAWSPYLIIYSRYDR